MYIGIASPCGWSAKALVKVSPGNPTSPGSFQVRDARRIFVYDDGLGVQLIGRHSPDCPDGGFQLWRPGPIAVQQHEIHGFNQGRWRHPAARLHVGPYQAGGIDKIGVFFSELIDHRPCPLGDKTAISKTDMGLVRDLDKQVAVSCPSQEGECLARRTPYGLLIPHLAHVHPVEQAHDHHHAQLVGAGQRPRYAVGVGRFQIALWREAIVIKVVVDLGRIKRPSSLKIDGKGQHAVIAPRGERRAELFSVSLGIPYTGVGIGPEMPGSGVGIVKCSLYGPHVKEQALDAMDFELAAWIGGLAIQHELKARNANLHHVPPSSSKSKLSRTQHCHFTPEWPATQAGAAPPVHGGTGSHKIAKKALAFQADVHLTAVGPGCIIRTTSPGQVRSRTEQSGGCFPGDGPL